MMRASSLSILLGSFVLWATASASAVDLNDGATVYATICSACHGPDPRQNVNLIALGAANPNLIRTQIAINPSMQYLKDLLTDVQINDVAAYIDSVVNPNGGSPNLVTTPSALNFAAQAVNTTNPGQIVTLSNTGSANLTIAGIGLTPTDFGLLSGCGGVLAPNAICQVTVTFTPRSVGNISGSLTIATNAADSPRVLLLTGCGSNGAGCPPPPAGCGSCTIGPTNNFFPYPGSGPGTTGDGVVTVSAPAGVAWSAISNVSWLNLVTGTSGTGNGSVTFSVAANAGNTQRVGTLTIAGQTFTVTQLGPPPTTGSVQIVEYHNSAQDDYFITADPTEQQALDAAAQSGAVWSRTGMSFYAGGSASVYRFIYRSSTGTNTHFYTVNTGEQSGLLANYPIWVLESPVAFYMAAANANQTCPAGTVPVYRAAQEQTGSHRFTTIQSAINEVLARGWTSEGVAFCAPQGVPLGGAPQ